MYIFNIIFIFDHFLFGMIIPFKLARLYLRYILWGGEFTLSIIASPHFISVLRIILNHETTKEDHYEYIQRNNAAYVYYDETHP
jgi:hypothetical protein